MKIRNNGIHLSEEALMKFQKHTLRFKPFELFGLVTLFGLEDEIFVQLTQIPYLPAVFSNLGILKAVKTRRNVPLIHI